MKLLHTPAAFTVVAASAVLALLAVALPAGPGAATANAQAVVQSYIADTPLQAGMLVRLVDDKRRVTTVTQKTADSQFGLVVRPNDAPLSLTASEPGQVVYVATAGNYQMLVSDQNGPVNQGDFIVVSAIEGIGMKVNNDASYVAGRAVTRFDGTAGVLSKTTVKDVDGRERTVRMGYVMATINTARNPLHRGTEAKVPSFLQKTADAIAGKPVGAIRVYISLAVTLVTGSVAMTVLYAGIRSGIIALGRNPLARTSISRSLLQVILIGLIVLIVGLFIVYLLLKL